MCRHLHFCLQDSVGLNASYSTMCVDVFTSLLTKETSMIPIKRFLCQVCRDASIELDLAHGDLQRRTDVGLEPRLVPGTR